MEGEIELAVADGVGRITLNRPKALNALTLSQIEAMHAALKRWAGDDEVLLVTIGAVGGKAFCAGGDIRSLFEARKKGDYALLAGFYREEYILNRLIKTFPKPFVALIDGIVMGGGVGVSIHGSHRVATEHTLFAMPETGIGLFPDVGGTYFLPRCPGEVGMYLALTGVRLQAADALYAGLMTHFVPAAKLPDMTAALRGLTGAGDHDAAVTSILDGYHETPGPAPLAAHRAAIDRCFGGASVDAVVTALEADDSEWAASTLRVLATKSPTSLKVTFRQMRLGRDLDFDAAMRMEYRLSQRFMTGHEFFEGGRAVIIDKDHAPQWRPATLMEVGEAEVNAYFAPLAAERELAFD